jgi:hypothetical protein
MRKVVLAAMLAGILCVPAQALAKVDALDPSATGTPTRAGEALVADGSQLTGAALPERPFGSSSASSSIGVGDRSVGPAPESLAGFPTSGDGYTILSTGTIGTIATQFSAGFQGSTQFASQTSPAPAARGAARDWTVLKLGVDVPASANCLAFDFRFLSEEYPKYIGSDYNDAFVAEVDANSWSVSPGGELIRPSDFAASPLGAPISVNGVGPTEMTTAEAAGTYFNAATRLLTARTPITPGAHSVYLSIFDSSDKKYDSAVFVDNLRFVRLAASACRPFTAEPKVALVIAKAGAGSGEVTSSPAGIACGLDCEEEYEAGQIVDLTAVAAPDSEFSGWSGAGCEGTGVCEATVSEAGEVTATFDPLPPPDAPSLSSTSPASPANDTTPLVIGSAPAGTTVSLYASADCSGAPIITAATPAQLTAGIEVTVAANAVTRFSATTASASPSASACSNSISYTEDSTAPTTTIDAAPVSPTAANAASFSFSATDPGGSGVAGFECSLDAGAFTPCTSPQAYDSLADGAHGFEVRATDNAANSGAAAASAWSVDTVAPATTIDAKPASPTAANTASFSFSATDEPGGSGVAGFECKLDAAFAPCTSPKSYGSLGDGAHKFAVRAIDAVGNVAPEPASYAWTVDTSVPAAPPVAPLVFDGLGPVNGESVALAPESGKVLVKRPGQSKFVPLKEGQTIPIGSVVDATAGRAGLTSVNPTGIEQTASFYAGRFLVAQQEGSGLVTLRLRGGSFSACASSSGRRPLATASGKSGRRLWGSGKGNFRTEGSNGSATVRGTIWLTEDRCDGTFFEVRRGIVSVRDFSAGKTLLLPAGESYLTGSG